MCETSCDACRLWLKDTGRFVGTLSPATSVPVNPAPLYAIMALITAAVVTVCYLSVRRLREKGSAVVGAARPSRRAARGVNVKAINIASKGIRQTLRDRVGFVLLLGLPVLLILILALRSVAPRFSPAGPCPTKSSSSTPTQE
ncbi:MAG: hypothetical protein WAL97_10920 [Halobacteriota archaeon]